jgi:hypothetical protein
MSSEKVSGYKGTCSLVLVQGQGIQVTVPKLCAVFNTKFQGRQEFLSLSKAPWATVAAHSCPAIPCLPGLPLNACLPAILPASYPPSPKLPSWWVVDAYAPVAEAPATILQASKYTAGAQSDTMVLAQHRHRKACLALCSSTAKLSKYWVRNYALCLVLKQHSL